MEKAKWMGIALIPVLVLGFIGCGGGDPKEPEKSDKAELISIRFGDGVGADKDTIELKLPAAGPIDLDAWEALSANANLSSNAVLAEKKGTITVRTAANLGSVVTVSVSPNAKVSIARAAGSSANLKPGDSFFDEYESDFTFTGLKNNDWIVVEVISENGINTNYYIFQVSTLSNVASLTGLTISSVSVSNRGTPQATWNASGLVAGNVTLGTTQLSVTSIIPNPTNAFATFRYAHTNNGTTEPQFGVTTTFSVLDGHFLWVEVTAQDRLVKLIYKIEILNGRNALLESLTISGTGIENGIIPNTDWGTPASTAAVAVAGNLSFMTIPQPDLGITVTGTAADAAGGATISFGKGTLANQESITYNLTGTNVFGAKDLLFVKVVSGNGNVTNIYKLNPRFLQRQNIPWGTIALNAATLATQTNWDAIPGLEMFVDRPGNDTAVAGFKDNPAAWITNAVAKATWDDENLYVAVKATKVKHEIVSSTTGTEHHTYDSVEVFVNESGTTRGSTEAATHQRGGQYRIRPRGTGTEGIKSADANALGTAISGVTSLGTGADLFVNGTGTSSAHIAADNRTYYVVFRIPWRYRTSTAEGWAPVNDKEFLFELQINVTNATGGPNQGEGVVVWNNSGTTTNWRNSTNWGVARLIGKPGS